MKFLQRLGTLIGAVITWFIMTLALPVLFIMFGVAIVGACVWSMRQKGGTHPPGIQFSVFGGVTILFAVISILVSPSAEAEIELPPDIPPEIAETMEASEDEEEASEDGDEVAAAEETPEEAEPGEEGSEEESVSDASPETLRLASAQEGVEQAAAVAKDKARCANIDEVAGAWEKLQVAKKGDPMFRDARKVSKRLEKCRKKAMRKIPKKERKTVLAEKGMDKALRLK